MQIIALLSTLLSLAAAEFIIDSPFNSAKANSDVTSTWQYDGTPAIAGTVQIDLVNGPDFNLVVVTNVATGVNPNAATKSITWKVPDLLEGEYALRVTGSLESGASLLRFNSRFTVTGGGGTANNAQPGTVPKGVEPPKSAAPPANATVTPTASKVSAAKKPTATAPAEASGAAGNLLTGSAAAVVLGLLSLIVL